MKRLLKRAQARMLPLLLLLLATNCLQAQLRTYSYYDKVPDLRFHFYENAQEDKTFKNGLKYSYLYKMKGGTVLYAYLTIDTTMKCNTLQTFERNIGQFKKEFYMVKDSVRDVDGWGTLEITYTGIRDNGNKRGYLKMIGHKDYALICEIEMLRDMVKEADVYVVLNNFSVLAGQRKFQSQKLEFPLPGSLFSFEIKERPKALGITDCRDKTSAQLMTVEIQAIPPDTALIQKMLDSYIGSLSKKANTTVTGRLPYAELKETAIGMSRFTQPSVLIRHTEKQKDGTLVHYSDYFLVEYQTLRVLRCRFEMKDQHGNSISNADFERKMLEDVLYYTRLMDDPEQTSLLRDQLRPKNLKYDAMGFSMKIPARIIQPQNLYSSPQNVFEHFEWCFTAEREKEVKRLFSYNSWPTAFADQFGDESGGVWQRVRAYVVCRLDNKVILYVPHLENTHLSLSERPDFDFYMVFDVNGVQMLVDE